MIYIFKLVKDDIVRLIIIFKVYGLFWSLKFHSQVFKGWKKNMNIIYALKQSSLIKILGEWEFICL